MEKKILAQELKIMNNIYNRANTKGKKKLVAEDLVSFEELYNRVYPFSNSKMIWSNDDDIYNIYTDMALSYKESFLENVLNDQEFYKNLSLNVLDAYDKTNFNFYRYNTPLAYLKRLSITDIIEMLNVFTKHLGKKYNDYFIKKYKDYEIFLIDSYDCDGEYQTLYAGMTTQIGKLGKNYIFLEEKFGMNLHLAQTLAHEFGHSVEMYINAKSSNTILEEISYKTPYYEISSCFFETAFLNYIKENKLYLDSVSICLDHNYKDIFTYFSTMLAILKIDDIKLNNGELTIQDEAALKCLDIIKNTTNYHNLPSKGDSVSYVNTFIYALGRLASIYMYEEFTKDKEKFMYEFDKSLSSYQSTESLESFSSLGISKENLLDNKILSKTLVNHK